MLTYIPRVRSSTPGAFCLNAGATPAPGYKLTRVRGRGGFAEVWESESPSGRPVALKFMVSSNTSTTARELRTIQSFQSLDHPYLVRTHAVWSVPGYIVIAMELADATLLDLMLVYHNDLGQHIPVPQLCLYLLQIADALDFLNTRQHSRDGRKVGFQHGDVKPNNILLFQDEARLTDHGLATITSGPVTPCPRQGTREYAAPEVFQGYLSETSDQYSLAMTYHVLRTGTFPFPPPPTELPRSYHRPAPDLSLLLPTEQAALIRALAPVPQERYPTCREFVQALLRAHMLKAERREDSTTWQILPDPEAIPDPPPSRLLRPTGAGRALRPG